MKQYFFILNRIAFWGLLYLKAGILCANNEPGFPLENGNVETAFLTAESPVQEDTSLFENIDEKRVDISNEKNLKPEEKIFYPGSERKGEELEKDNFLNPPSMTSMVTQIVIYLGVLSALAYGFLHLSKRRSLPGMPKKKEQLLKICETKMLGNKQFLVVVEYGHQRMLLGVSQGSIEHLCYLNTGLEDDSFLKDALKENLNRNFRNHGSEMSLKENLKEVLK